MEERFEELSCEEESLISRNKKIGENIRKARIVKGWNIREVSYEVNLSPNYIGELEFGRRSITYMDALRLKRELPISLEDMGFIEMK